ncbi:outer membrane protein assembly factor BamE [Thiorhodococcus mannitoliphagus]|uniref:Outer membrane protein assembly factor BamE n=1 Tax=Thiorhodococcus mannitoliphagus TaxID=329406 RepID=A0A6P1DYL0_9GAMM|nr:outer membrane protein assembly factor BamE [Thiorhodococcus mannitoliphagus]NEX20655.1 outer membrane protein assembly factor BamE [Thiorhodococcus mannitoliphagus]
MRKIFSFTIIACLAAISIGCARDKKPDEYKSSVLEDLPFVYKMTVQQGNIITEEMVDSLELGMTKRQVEFVLGTPLLTDFFHTNRWDYVYTIRRGHQKMEQRDLTLYFQDDVLARMAGDIRPDANRAEEREQKEILVTVPDYDQRKGVLSRGLKAVGLEPKD